MTSGVLTLTRRAALAGAMLLVGSGAAFAADKIVVVTPYLAQPGTQFYVEAFQAEAKTLGWDVNVVDTKGDVAAVISRLEDAANQKVKAIVINVDPGQVTAGLEAAKAAGVPVFGMDAGANPLLVTNVTSNGYAMAADTATYVVNRINGKGKVVMFVFDAFPPVQMRGVIADAIFKNNPDIKVLDRVTPDVKDGGIADSRAKMEAILAANPDKGSISAVWAAWDQPALGALQAIEAAGRGGEGIVITGIDANPDKGSISAVWAAWDQPALGALQAIEAAGRGGEGIVITGIDANPQAREAIGKGGNFEASMAQDFKGIGAATANAVKRHLAGEAIKQSVIYVPTKLITAANVKE
jgi:ribose transport system substrate-binding protein